MEGEKIMKKKNEKKEKNKIEEDQDVGDKEQTAIN